MFFLLSNLFMYSGVVFVLFLSVYLFCGMNVFCWGGYLLVFDSYLFVVMGYMSLFVMGLIIMCEVDYIMIFLSECLVVICLVFFFSSNMMMLYIFFELSIFPVVIMILGFGSQVEKISASYYLIFYAVFCSSPFLYVYFCSKFCLFFGYYMVVVSYEMVIFLTLCFLVKFPVYFLHLWLPKAHVEAPTTASMLLAGLLLKLGTLGYLRLMMVYNYVYVFFWGVLSLLGMILGSFLCLVQSDMKALVAYSSVVHMSFVLMVLILLCGCGKLSGGLMMLSHGFVSTLMFYLVGEFYHISGTRLMSYMSGFMNSSMIISYMMMLVFMCNGGLPPSLSFFSEFIGLVGLYLSYSSLFIFLFVYFFVAFYYCFYIMTGAIMGKNFICFSLSFVYYMVPGMLLMFNIFWIGMLF
uniref:NADH-ubiquinone oxidoreductase chain 4 n=1 Tax=Syphacia muris TaxID=451379 RepID=A0A347YCD4_9BILA|nr:NADH dehydrogenase subunit 4 [Syphacia muris]